MENAFPAIGQPRLLSELCGRGRIIHDSLSFFEMELTLTGMKFLTFGAWQWLCTFMDSSLAFEEASHNRNQDRSNGSYEHQSRGGHVPYQTQSCHFVYCSDGPLGNVRFAQSLLVHA